TVYGQSKGITEQLTREAHLTCTWTIVRPTNIWGPWHQRYQKEFWRVVAKGWYSHPGCSPVVRCYGYVGNVLQQVRRMLDEPPAHVNGQVFYAGDPLGDIARWANAFSLALRGHKIRKVPRPILAAAGLVGDAISRMIGRPFYITSSRYHSMTSDYL